MICGYYVATTWRGALGALRLVYYHLPGATNAEARKHAALSPATRPDNRAYFNLAFEAAEQPAQPIRLPIADDNGMLAELILDGVEARLVATKQGLSNSLFVYVAQQLEDRLQAQGVTEAIQIVAWSRVDEEAAATYQSRFQAFRALAAWIGKGPIWPTQRLSRADLTWLETRLRHLTPTLRDECFLPNVAYGAAYSIPIIPEPLGFIILRRTEQRADAVAALGCAALGLMVITSVLILIVVFPLWIPSR